MSLPETASFSEFATIIGVKRGYITQLRKDDRLVLTDDGKSVRVAESIERIEATKDPTRMGVVQRHAVERTQTPAPTAAEEVDSVEQEPPATTGYQHWRERGERAKALAAERENEIAEGKLMNAADVESEIASAATTVRTSLEAIPDMLAPQLAIAKDESQVRAILTESIEHVLSEMSRHFSSIAKAAA